MKKILLLATSVLILFTGCSFDECSSKKMFLKSFDKFVENVKDDYSDFTKEDWEIKDEKFKKFSEECYKKFESKLTGEEREQFFKNTLEYTLYRVKFEIPINLSDLNINEISKSLNLIGDKAQDFSEFLEKLEKDEDFKKSLKNFQKGLESLGKGMESLGKGFEKYMEDLEKAFDNIDKEKGN